MFTLAGIIIWFTLSLSFTAFSVMLASNSMMKFREMWVKEHTSSIVWNDDKRRNASFLVIVDCYIDEHGRKSYRSPLARYYGLLGFVFLCFHSVHLLVMLVAAALGASNNVLIVAMMGFTLYIVTVLVHSIRYGMYPFFLNSALRMYYMYQESAVKELYQIGYTMVHNGFADEFYFTNGTHKTPPAKIRDHAIDNAVNDLKHYVLIIKKSGGNK